MRTRIGRLKGRFGRGVSVRALAAVGMLGGARAAQASDGGATDSTAPSISPRLATTHLVQGTTTPAPAHYNNLSPYAINYADCSESIDVGFTLDLANIPAGDEIQAWAGVGSADCTEPAARTAGGTGAPDVFPGRCWPVSTPITPSGATSTPTLHVKDLVAFIGQTSSIAATYAGTTSAAASSSVCHPLATTGAVQLNVYFMFVPAGSGTGTGDAGLAAAQPVDGYAAVYQTPAALVGPYAPANVAIQNTGVQATSLTVSWSPVAESDVQGFNVYVTSASDAGVAVDAAATHVPPSYECHEPIACTVSSAHDAGSVDAGGDAEAKDAGTTDGDADATIADASDSCDGGLTDALYPVDAAGYTDATLAAFQCISVPGTNDNGGNGTTGSPWCYSPLFQNLFTIDAGQGSVAVTATDASSTTSALTVEGDSGVVDSGSGDTGSLSISGTGTSSSVGETAGISDIALTPFFTEGNTTASYTVTGLTTGQTYAIAVAAVDSYGNVGPIGVAPSPTTSNSSGLAACSVPTPIDDFFNQYGMDGGLAGGGYCALIAVGARTPFAASTLGLGIAVALVRLRRRRSERKVS